MAVFPVILDSCVLYPMYVRDTLLYAAYRGLYRPHWSEEILEGAFRNLLQNNERMTPAKVERIKRQMQRSFPEAMVVVTERLLPCMDNHEGDRHVLAAALIAKAHVIVTNNLKHFPPSALEPLNVTAQSADDFLLSLLDLSPTEMLDSLQYQAAAKNNPRLEVPDLLSRLEGQLPKFVAQARSAWR